MRTAWLLLLAGCAHPPPVENLDHTHDPLTKICPGAYTISGPAGCGLEDESQMVCGPEQPNGDVLCIVVDRAWDYAFVGPVACDKACDYCKATMWITNLRTKCTGTYATLLISEE